ncbi:hypothetical protein [Amycolatopsis dendrobii]|uniref:Uncharacterized protein n=1 Tax=Amycolatopsis dendrobii TaxID=2760662 RepID=A0A7W3VS15_9PSEU|nr:hypothetical protein [Amycolatopsis dendrobii]MBB1151732.1 hypothetical protein [Amycolatopsis dendrobii]
MHTSPAAPPVGVLGVDLPITMTPSNAYNVLTAAGIVQPFQYILLHKPLTPPPWHRRYRFSATSPGGCGYSVSLEDGGIQAHPCI